MPRCVQANQNSLSRQASYLNTQSPCAFVRSPFDFYLPALFHKKKLRAHKRKITNDYKQLRVVVCNMKMYFDENVGS